MRVARLGYEAGLREKRRRAEFLTFVNVAVAKYFRPGIPAVLIPHSPRVPSRRTLESADGRTYVLRPPLHVSLFLLSDYRAVT